MPQIEPPLESLADRLIDIADLLIRELKEKFFFRAYQYRFPKSKKKRIRKKWRKDYGNYRVEQIEGE